MDWLEEMATQRAAAGEPSRSTTPEPGAASAAAYTEIVRTWGDMTPEQKAEQAEINRRGLAKVREVVARLGSKFSMPDGEKPERPPLPEVPAVTTWRPRTLAEQKAELKRMGLYDGQEKTA